MPLADGTTDMVTKRTAYLGPAASFSHQAAIEALPETEPVPLPSFDAILSALQDAGTDAASHIDYAVLPIENSTNGSVVQALDLLAQCRLGPEASRFPDILAIDEHYLEVHHCLFVSRKWAEQKLSTDELALFDPDVRRDPSRKRLETLLSKLDIKILYTHPQVWGQCNKILSSLLPPGHVERVDMSSTSAAAAYVANHHCNVQDGDLESGIAAISSALAGAKHGQDLICLAQNIEDEPGSNTTRFLVLANQCLRQKPSFTTNRSTGEVQVKSLWTFTISHYAPGSLANALAVFARHSFNLSAIQSRPKPKVKSSEKSVSSKFSNWKYVFFVECLHNRSEASLQHDDEDLGNLLVDLRSVTEQLSFLGSWMNRLPADIC